ncbi:NADH:flavin oxidoreductase [Francisella sp. 19X1-34]|uniref:NADH:flavin oxidoreductase n=1 Tax=Francisella sp. 19X1-34 TaxID=3087177 RepID=UPI002E31C5CC|nr:NADH:flavin oxidoreductase [Francisella sp. 19X1-34]MED7788163.1 NADH:flavin oxidoreductase [Francisella sp. 19X1-34]
MHRISSPYFKDKLIAKNRLVASAMTTMQSCSDGFVSEKEYLWLEKMAQGGFGTIITCASHVSKTGQSWEGQMAIYDDKYLPGLKKLANMIKSYTAIGLVQLFHGGSRSPKSITGVQPSSASEFHLPIADFETPRELRVIEIEAIVKDFASATKRAYQAGFSGVEIHAANGYLFTQFISTTTNLRNDEYGGDLKGRSKLLLDVVRACRSCVPDDFIIGVKLSPLGDGLDVNEMIQIAAMITKEGVDFINLSLVNVQMSLDSSNSDSKPLVSYVCQRLGSKVTLLSGGGIYTAKQAKQAIDLGLDFITLGRAAIGNPNWPNLVQENQNIDIPPYKEEDLQKIISQEFLQYIKTQLPPGFTQTLIDNI